MNARTLIAGILAATTLSMGAAQAFERGYDRGHDRGDGRDRGGRGRGGYSQECQSAIDNVRYCQGQVRQYQDLYNGPTCRGDQACKYKQAQALQYTIQQLQKAESERDRACN